MSIEGVFDISIEEYHGEGSISRSMLMELQRSALHFHYKYLDPTYVKPEPVDIITTRDALGFGNALHTAVLEPDTFYDRYAVWDGMSRATKAGKEAWAELLNTQTRKQIIASDACDVAMDMRANIMRHPLAGPLLTQGLNEKSLFWRDKETNILFKCRPDAWHDDLVVDLKTAADGSPDAFERSIYSRGYHLQAAMIQAGIFAVNGKRVDNFCFVVIEKEPPYAIGVYQLDEVALEVGRNEFTALKLKLREHISFNEWPSYPDKTLTLPNYIMNKVQP